MKTGRVGASVYVRGSRIRVNRYIIDQERYQRLPSLVGAEKTGLFASIKEQNAMEDELEVGVGSLIMVYLASGPSLHREIFLHTFWTSSTILPHILSEWKVNNSDWSKSSHACSSCIEV